MIKNSLNYFLIASVIIGIFFIVTALNSKRGKDNSLIYLNLVELFFTLNNLQIVIIDNFYTNANFFIRNLLIPFYALIVPTYYIFINYYLRLKDKITTFEISISLFFLFEIGVRFVLGFYYYSEDKNIIVAKYSQIEEIINA